MKHKHQKDESDSELSEIEKRAWDKIINNLVEYFNTENGTEFYERFADLMSRVEDQSVARSLSDVEHRALVFIQKERKQGRSPSVRTVSKTLGFRSSRSGHRIVSKLKDRGLI